VPVIGQCISPFLCDAGERHSDGSETGVPSGVKVMLFETMREMGKFSEFGWCLEAGVQKRGILHKSWTMCRLACDL
jgi:hypothetical protein